MRSIITACESLDTSNWRDGINYEAIQLAEPDLIVATNSIMEQAEYDQLSAIAPVLGNPEEVTAAQRAWEDDQTLVGEALDLSAAADQLVADAETEIAAIADAHPEFDGKTLTIFTDQGPEWGMQYYSPAGGTAETVAMELGFAPNPTAEQFVDDDQISEENQTQLDADVLVGIYWQAAHQPEREENALFQAIPAVADGRYIGVLAEDTAGDAYGAGWVLRRGASSISMPWAVDVVANDWLADVEP